MSIQFPNLGINLDYVGKSIQIFGFEITFFGLCNSSGNASGNGICDSGSEALRRE